MTIEDINIEEMSDNELVEKIFYIAVGKTKAVDYINRINSKFGNIFNFIDSDMHTRIELTDRRTAILCSLIKIIAKKNLEGKITARGELENAIKLLVVALFGKRVEEVIVLYYQDKRRKPIIKSLSEGTNNQSIFPVDAIIETAIMYGVDRIIVGHNHPNGFAIHSYDDIMITNHLYTTAKKVGIELVDHIVTKDGKVCTLSNGKGLAGITIGEYVYFRKYCDQYNTIKLIQSLQRHDAMAMLNSGKSPWERT